MNGAKKNRQDVRELLSAAVESHRDGLTKLYLPDRDLEDRFNREHLLRMAKTLSLGEISVCLKAAQVREKGLVMARSGDICGARATLHEAKLIYTKGGLSEEAFLAADSFQSAADAYVEYKSGEHAKARALLMATLESCRSLHDAYDYRVEVRRIHIVRNIIRVEVAAGNQPAAMKFATMMLRYLDGDDDIWPFPQLRLARKPHALATDEKAALLDQLLGEVALILSQHTYEAHELRELFAPQRSKDSATDEASRASVWLAAMRASFRKDTVAFLSHASRFFARGRSHNDHAWRVLEETFFKVWRKVMPDARIASSPAFERDPR